MASQSTLEIVPLAAGLGAAIHGADVTGPRAEEDFGLIRQAFIDHGVVLFYLVRMNRTAKKDCGAILYGSANCCGIVQVTGF